MLRADELFAAPAAAVGGGADDAAAGRSQPLMEGLARNARPDLSGDGSADGLGGGAGAVESGACRVASPLCQCQQEMLAAHITVTQPKGLFLCLTKNPGGGGSKQAFCHKITSEKFFLTAFPKFKNLALHFPQDVIE
jgi:hypothetical protein